MIKSSFYVDHCLSGADSPGEALKLEQELCQLLAEGKMLLRKWRSNSAEVLQQIPEQIREMTDLTISDPARSLKTLGVHWATATDEFHIATPDLPEGPATKRVISSAGARTFDVLGWYAPALLYIKILLQ